jgi:type I restriction enzyme R subunit
LPAVQSAKHGAPVGDFYVFIDEAHRTQSGKLARAMRQILPAAMFVGFTGTPLLKSDKSTSLETFGPYIGKPYRFDEAGEDGVVLDLRYEARDIEQRVGSHKKIDDWFDENTKTLTTVAKATLKARWGTVATGVVEPGTVIADCSRHHHGYAEEAAPRCWPRQRDFGGGIYSRGLQVL